LITFWESIVVSGVAVQPSLLCCASERVPRVSLLANLLSEVHRPCIAAISLPEKKTPGYLSAAAARTSACNEASCQGRP
jgi:hypothetical protein